jgi:hypothetical protein
LNVVKAQGTNILRKLNVKSQLVGVRHVVKELVIYKGNPTLSVPNQEVETHRHTVVTIKVKVVRLLYSKDFPIKFIVGVVSPVKFQNSADLSTRVKSITIATSHDVHEVVNSVMLSLLVTYTIHESLVVDSQYLMPKRTLTKCLTHLLRSDTLHERQVILIPTGKPCTYFRVTDTSYVSHHSHHKSSFGREI